MKHIKAWLLAALALAAVGGGLALSSAGATPSPPPQFPGVFAGFAHALQANRGGAEPLSVEQPASASAQAITVTDAEGSYKAFFTARTYPQPSSLTQVDNGSDQAWIWLVDSRTNEIVSGPTLTHYTSKTITIGRGQPGSSTTPPPVDPNQPSASLGRTHSAQLMAVYLGIDTCVLITAAPVQSAFLDQWWIIGGTTWICDEVTSIFTGAAIDQVGWDLAWHSVGDPDDLGNGAVTLLNNAALQPCLDQGTVAEGGGGVYPFRTRADGIAEYDGDYALDGQVSPVADLLCQDSSIWTGKLAS